MSDLVRRWAPRILLACLALYFASAILPFAPVEGDEQGVINGVIAAEQHRPDVLQFAYIYAIQPGSFAIIRALHALGGGSLIAILGVLTALGATGFVIVMSFLGARLCQCRPTWIALGLLATQEIVTAAWYANTCAMAAVFPAAALLFCTRNGKGTTWFVAALLIAIGGWIRMDSLLIAPVFLPLVYAESRNGRFAIKATAIVAGLSAVILMLLLKLSGTSIFEAWKTFVEEPPGEGWVSFLHLSWLSSSVSMSALIIVAGLVLALTGEYLLLSGAVVAILPAVLVYGDTFTTTKYLYYALPFAVFLVVRLIIIYIRTGRPLARAFAGLFISALALEALLGVRTSVPAYRRFQMGSSPRLAEVTISRAHRPLQIVLGEGEILGTDDAFRLRTGWAFAPRVWRREKIAMLNELKVLAEEVGRPNQTIITSTYLSNRVVTGELLGLGWACKVYKTMPGDIASFYTEWENQGRRTVLVLVNNSPIETDLFSQYTHTPGRIIFINDRGRNAAHYLGINDSAWHCRSPNEDDLLTTYIKNIDSK